MGRPQEAATMSRDFTLVCFAVKEEARPFENAARGHARIQVLITGMGATNAMRSVEQALQNQRPSRVVTAGFAGGLALELAKGSVVYDCDPGADLESKLREAGARPGRFHCSPRVVTTAAEKRALLASTRADAVEMESGCIHQLCAARQIPAATVRVILDTASEDLALDFNQLMTHDQKLDARKLALTILKSPMKIGALLELQKQSAAAARRLGEVLARILL